MRTCSPPTRIECAWRAAVGRPACHRTFAPESAPCTNRTSSAPRSSDSSRLHAAPRAVAVTAAYWSVRSLASRWKLGRRRRRLRGLRGRSEAHMCRYFEATLSSAIGSRCYCSAWTSLPCRMAGQYPSRCAHWAWEATKRACSFSLAGETTQIFTMQIQQFITLQRVYIYNEIFNWGGQRANDAREVA